MKATPMKQLFQEMGYFLMFVLMIMAFEISMKAALAGFSEAIEGEIKWITAGYMVLVCVAMAAAAIEVYAWLHRFVAKTRGLKFFEKLIQDKAIALAEEKTALENKLLEYADANKRLSSSNEALTEDLNFANDTIARLVDDNLKPKYEHFDDWALDHFVVQMRATLKRKREEGRSGWVDCQEELLFDAFVEQVESLNVEKTNMVNSANHAMFVWVRNAYPVECAQASYMPVRDIQA